MKRSLFEHPALLGAGLFLLTILLYWEARHYQFVGLDDHIYVWNNPYVIDGVTWSGIRYVFGNAIFSTYHPLTWLSLMADSSLFSLNAGSYHRTSIALHAANVLLLFLFLRRATGAALPAAFVAGLFAVHPLNVEPVAWISSRKDVLSGFFFLLGLWAYCAIPMAKTYWRIGLVTIAYSLSLLAKPSMVTFPFVLLLLDYWPLARYGDPPTLQWKTVLRLTAEKASMFVILVISMIATSLSANDSLSVNAQVHLFTRMQDAIVNYALYLGKFFVPIGLSAQYPYDTRGWTVATVAGSAVLLIGVTALAWFTRRRYSFIAVGWLWFTGVMLPLCGILIVGVHNRADRYMYIPIIGILIVLTWGALTIAKRFNTPPALLRTTAIIVIAGYTIVGWRELQHWENEKTLATQMLNAHDWNPMGHYLMGKALEGEGDNASALASFQRQLQLTPDDPSVYIAIGDIQTKLGAYNNAAMWYRNAINLSPGLAQPYYGLAVLEIQRGNFFQARQNLERCLEIQPHHEAARHVLAELDAAPVSARE
jgi:tetratricopeptide (TPR) repeat protein